MAEPAVALLHKFVRILQGNSRADSEYLLGTMAIKMGEFDRAEPPLLATGSSEPYRHHLKPFLDAYAA